MIAELRPTSETCRSSVSKNDDVDRLIREWRSEQRGRSLQHITADSNILDQRPELGNALSLTSKVGRRYVVT
jgi:hypothetical protein